MGAQLGPEALFRDDLVLEYDQIVLSAAVPGRRCQTEAPLQVAGPSLQLEHAIPVVTNPGANGWVRVAVEENRSGDAFVDPGDSEGVEGAGAEPG